MGITDRSIVDLADRYGMDLSDLRDCLFDGKDYKEVLDSIKSETDFWDLIIKNDIPPVYAILINQDLPNIPFVLDLGDKRLCMWSKRTWIVEPELFKEVTNYADYFKYSRPIRMEAILKSVVSVLKMNWLIGSNENQDFLMSVLHKDLITESDCSRCIQLFRENELDDLIPLLVLKACGQIPLAYYEKKGGKIS